MNTKDGRALPHKMQEDIHKRADSRVLAGKSPEAGLPTWDFQRSCIDDWIKEHLRCDEAHLATRPFNGGPRNVDDGLRADELRERTGADPTST